MFRRYYLSREVGVYTVMSEEDDVAQIFMNHLKKTYIRPLPQVGYSSQKEMIFLRSETKKNIKLPETVT